MTPDPGVEPRNIDDDFQRSVDKRLLHMRMNLWDSFHVVKQRMAHISAVL